MGCGSRRPEAWPRPAAAANAPPTSARAKPAFSTDPKQAGCPCNHAVSHPHEQRQHRRRADRARDQSQNQLRVDVQTDVVLESRSGAQAGHRLQERRRLRHRVGPEEHPAD